MSKYFLIEYNSKYVYNDPQKIIADSIKQAVEYAKKQLADLRDDYILRASSHRDAYNAMDDYKRIHKRMRVTNMYVDMKDGSTKITGKVVTLTGTPKDDFDWNENPFGDSVVSAWIHHIPTSQVKEYAGFEVLSA